MTLLSSRSLTTRPHVSVVIPCYNYGHYLPQAVASALDQSGVDVDVLIVDDASTDGSDRVALEIAGSDPRVDVLLHETNVGHIQTYNDGLAKITGRYVVLLSADDLLAPDSLTRSVALLEADPTIVMVYGFPVDFEACPPAPRPRVRSWSVWDGSDWVSKVCAAGRNIVVNPEVVLRTSVMNELEGYRAEHPHAADLELWLRAASRGRVGRVNGPDQAYYRVHGSNMHSTEFAGLLTDLTAVRRVFDSFLAPDDALSLPGRDRLRARARRAMARDALRVACSILDAGDASRAAEAEGLALFAESSSPGVLQSGLGRAYGARVEGRVGRLRRASRRDVERLRWALRWHRWRRWGH